MFRNRGKSEVRADKEKSENSHGAVCPGEIRRNKDSFEANSLRQELE